jgi:hypothetical protein
MRAHVISNGIVVNTIEVESLGVMPGLVSADNGGTIGDIYEDGEFKKPPIDLELLASEIVAATQQRLDAFAQTRGYDGILSACTYADDPVQKFAAEGRYCVAARGATWAKLYEILGEVESGSRPAPSSYADIENELPALVWPE